MTDRRSQVQELESLRRRFSQCQVDMTNIHQRLLVEITAFVRDQNAKLLSHVLRHHAAEVSAMRPEVLQQVKKLLSDLDAELGATIGECVDKKCWWPHRDLQLGDRATWSHDRGLRFVADEAKSPRNATQGVLGLAARIWYDHGCLGDGESVGGVGRYGRRYRAAVFFLTPSTFAENEWPAVPSLAPYLQKAADLAQIVAAAWAPLRESERAKAEALWDRTP